jgi:hypothetical protein
MNGESPLLPAPTTGCQRTRLLVAMAWLLAARGALGQEPSGTSASVEPDPGHPYLLGVQATEVVEATRSAVRTARSSSSAR